MRRPITVSYAFKKDTKGERHGTPAERLLAEQQRTKAAAASRPHTLFASGPRQRPDGGLPSAGQPEVGCSLRGLLIALVFCPVHLLALSGANPRGLASLVQNMCTTLVETFPLVGLL
jgi:hypothetical protein